MKKLLLAATVVRWPLRRRRRRTRKQCSTGPVARVTTASCRWRRKGRPCRLGPRLAKGMPTLVQHVTNGFNAMPPRGLCTDCSAEDYQATIQWMVKK